MAGDDDEPEPEAWASCVVAEVVAGTSSSADGRCRSRQDAGTSVVARSLTVPSARTKSIQSAGGIRFGLLRSPVRRSDITSLPPINSGETSWQGSRPMVRAA